MVGGSRIEGDPESTQKDNIRTSLRMVSIHSKENIVQFGESMESGFCLETRIRCISFLYPSVRYK